MLGKLFIRPNVKQKEINMQTSVKETVRDVNIVKVLVKINQGIITKQSIKNDDGILSAANKSEKLISESFHQKFWFT